MPCSTLIYCHLTAMKVVDYCLAGWSHSLVVLHRKTTIAFANFSNESRVTFVKFFSFIRDNVIVKILAFCSQLLNIHPRVCSFDSILFIAFSANLCISSLKISGNLATYFFWKIVVWCCPGNLVMSSIFAVIPLFHCSSDNVNQSNL